MNNKAFKTKGIIQDAFKSSSSDRLAEKLSKMFICFVIILFSFVVISLIAAIALYRETGICELIDERPSTDLLGLMSIASHDKTALVNLDAYIEFAPYSPGINRPQSMFMSFKLRNVTYKKTSDSGSKLSLETSCANLTLILSQEDDKTTVERVDVDLTEWFSISRMCSFRFPQIAFTDLNTHYLCDIEQRMDCAIDKRDGGTDKPGIAVASVVIYRLEYEIDGDPWKIGQGLFSKPAKYCPLNGATILD